MGSREISAATSFCKLERKHKHKTNATHETRTDDLHDGRFVIRTSTDTDGDLVAVVVFRFSGREEAHIFITRRRTTFRTLRPGGQKRTRAQAEREHLRAPR
jgi:hypothetical protein